MAVATRRLALSLALSVAAGPLALADIAGFGDFTGFSINQDDASAAPSLAIGRIGLTNRAARESRSIFYNTKQDITQFTASYTFEALGTPASPFGACFVMQNSSAGPLSVARYHASGIFTQFGYSDLFGVFGRSSAVSMEYASLAAGSSSTGLYRDGQVGGGSSSTNPVNLFSGHPIDVSLVYNGTILRQTFTDRVTGQSFERLSAVNLPSIVQGTTAYVGFVATSGNNANTEQWFSNFSFTVPAPGGVGVIGLGAIAGLRRRRR